MGNQDITSISFVDCDLAVLHKWNGVVENSYGRGNSGRLRYIFCDLRWFCVTCGCKIIY